MFGRSAARAANERKQTKQTKNKDSRRRMDGSQSGTVFLQEQGSLSLAIADGRNNSPSPGSFQRERAVHATPLSRRLAENLADQFNLNSHIAQMAAHDLSDSPTIRVAKSGRGDDRDAHGA